LGERLGPVGTLLSTGGEAGPIGILRSTGGLLGTALGELSEGLGPVGTLMSSGAELIGGKVGPMGPPIPTTSLQL
jgi:hypothetical protein